MRYLTIALTKGRLAYQTLELLEKVGITCDEMKNKDTRKLIFTDEEHKLRFFLAPCEKRFRKGFVIAVAVFILRLRFWGKAGKI